MNATYGTGRNLLEMQLKFRRHDIRLLQNQLAAPNRAELLQTAIQPDRPWRPGCTNMEIDVKASTSAGSKRAGCCSSGGCTPDRRTRRTRDTRGIRDSHD